MPTQITFPLEEVNLLRRRARDAWADRFPEETPEGWSISPLDLRPFLAVFSPLKLKPGYILRAYQFRYRRDGHTLVWALPETAVFPPPDPDAEDDPPPPPAALENIMDVIEGDGTPWSYLCASIFAREVSEIGTFGHGSRWAAHHLLGTDPWETAAASQPTSPDRGPTGTAWQWHMPKPKSWLPSVAINGHQPVVTLYTYCGLDVQRIAQHIDTYEPDSYRFTSQETSMATGPHGYVW